MLRWPLVGRAEELERIHGLLRRRATAGVVLAGQAGVGKTRLLNEVVALAEAGGWWVERAVASRATASIPFGPFAHLVTAPGGPPDLLAILQGAAAALAARAAERPLLLAVDDAHLLDEGSAGLVHHLAVLGKAVVVLSVRSGTTPPDAVTLLWKDGLAERIELQPLSREETWELVTAAVDGPVSPETLHHLWYATQGNALLLRELVLAALQAGSLSDDDGVWRWRGGAPTAARLREITASRLDDLAPPVRRSLEVLAVAETVGLGVLHDLTGDHAGELERRGWLTVTREDRRLVARISHPLYGEIIRDGLPTTRRQEIERALADAHEATGARRGDDLLRVATWRLGGGGAMSAAHLLAAAHRSLSLMDFALGERMAVAAQEAGGGFDALMLRVQALLGLGRFDEVDALLDELQATAADDEQRVAAAITHAEHLFWRRGRVHKAIGLLQRVHDELPDDGRRAPLQGALAQLLLFAGRTAAALRIGGEVFGDRRLPGPARLHAAPSLTFGLALAGRRDDAAEVAAEALTLTDGSAVSANLEMWVRTNMACADQMVGYLDEAEASVTSIYEAARLAGSPWLLGVLAWPVGLIARVRGRPVTGARWLRESVANLREIDLLNNLPACLAELAMCLALTGEAEEAQHLLAEAEQRRNPAFRLDASFVSRARPWVLAAGGRVTAAGVAAIEAAGVAESLGQHGMQAAALHDAARLGRAADVCEPLAAVAALTQGPLPKLFAEHAAALVAGDAGALLGVADRFAGLGMALCAAEAAAAAAAVHRAEGRSTAAVSAAARAEELLADCEGARTPALEDLQPLPLTPREREVATLAARGLSSRAIAEELVLSVRTVENHLQRTYAKLGAGSRAELADILLRPPR